MIKKKINKSEINPDYTLIQLKNVIKNYAYEVDCLGDQVIIHKDRYTKNFKELEVDLASAFLKKSRFLDFLNDRLKEMSYQDLLIKNNNLKRLLDVFINDLYVSTNDEDSSFWLIIMGIYYINHKKLDDIQDLCFIEKKKKEKLNDFENHFKILNDIKNYKLIIIKGAFQWEKIN